MMKEEEKVHVRIEEEEGEGEGEGGEEREARRQKEEKRKRSREGEMYNVWYHKTQGYRETVRRADREGGATRCDPERDSGRTRGSANPRAHLCPHFARGECAKGAQCEHLHRVPLEKDERSRSELYDVFGRAKFADIKSDQGGVGSFMAPTSTLYVGNLLFTDHPSAYALLARAFGVWGPLLRLRLFLDRHIAFVTYAWTVSAEFAKEAMIDQTLSHAALSCRLNVRWARDDPNPAAQARLQRELQRSAALAIQSTLSSTSSTTPTSSSPSPLLLFAPTSSSSSHLPSLVPY